MTAYEPWRYRMPDCGSHSWTYRHTIEEYVCQRCGDRAVALYDKKLEQKVRRPGDRVEHQQSETNA